MNKQDQQFDNLLKSARVPERSEGYWESFPKRVTVRLSEETQTGEIPPACFLLLGFGIGDGACVAALFGLWTRIRLVSAEPNYAKLYHEIESMFPTRYVPLSWRETV